MNTLQNFSTDQLRAALANAWSTAAATEIRAALAARGQYPPFDYSAPTDSAAGMAWAAWRARAIL